MFRRTKLISILKSEYNYLTDTMHRLHAFKKHEAKQKIIPKIHRRLEVMHPIHVADNLATYLTYSHADLLVHAKELRQALQTPSIHSLKQMAQLHAVEMALHPELAAVVLCDRGVYAAKAIRKLKEHGHRTILICQQEEETSLAATLADHVLQVEDLNNVAECMQSLNNFRRLLNVPGYTLGIDPGFGVLSENPELPKACLANDVVFIGPSEKPMATMGNKKLAKRLAEKAGVPVIPGYNGNQQDNLTLCKEASKIGFPLILKKGKAGGGYGNKIVSSLEELLLGAEAFRGSHSEEPIFLEKFLGNPKHIEVQVAIDQHSHAVLIGTRNCSLQRNCQKTIEEAPATIPELSKIQAMAIAIANEMINQGYTHLATIEFLVQDGNIYFLEVNPRIQVEHGITEAIHAGIDLIALKCWIAQSKRMIEFFEQALAKRNIASHHTSAQQMIELLRQHSPVKFAIEARVEALRFRKLETGELQKIPVQGTIEEVRLPDPVTDCGIQHGTKINNLKTNPLLALVIGHGATREYALRNLLQKLNETTISGVPTNLERLRDNIQYLLDHPNLDIDTSTTQLLDARHIHESMQEHEERQSRYLPTLFREPNVFATGKSRLPVERHHPSVGRSGSWD